MRDVVVVGAGLSGLACGAALGRSGLDVVVVDRSRAPGGVIQTRQVEGFLVEAGPNTLLPTPRAAEIIRELGLEADIVVAPRHLPRFIYLGGRLRKVPWVLSVRGMVRALLEPFVKSRREQGDESQAEFFTRRFGTEVHDRLVSPFVSGIYAGDTSRLGIEGTFPRLRDLERDYGSVLKGMLRSRRSRRRPGLSSFRAGMATLPLRLSEQVELRLGIQEVRLGSLEGDPGWEIQSSDGRIQAQCAVLALPAYLVGDCLQDSALATRLGEIDYAPVLVAAAALEERQLDAMPQGFGFLVPHTEGFRLLGTLFSSNLFPNRAPQGKILLTSFLGGARDPEIMGWQDDRIWETVDRELGTVLGFRDSIRPLSLFRYDRGIPQYRVGHCSWRQRVRDCLAERAGLFLTGNYLDGVSVPATLEHGWRTGQSVMRYLETRR